MKAIIPCAGYATRLHPLTIDKPKALLEVKGKPILDYVIERLEQIPEVDEVFIVTNNPFHMHFAWWLNQYSQRENPNKKRIKLINDLTTSNDDRLGTVGDVWHAIEKHGISDDLMIILGDNLFDFDLNKKISHFKKINKTLVGVYDVGDFNEAKNFGIVEVHPISGEIISFVEKPESPQSTLASIGLYIIPSQEIKTIKGYVDDKEKSNDRIGDLIAHFVEVGEVHAFPMEGRWFDIGSPETYKKVNEIW